MTNGTGDFDRRTFLASGTILAAAVPLAASAKIEGRKMDQALAAKAETGVSITLRINGGDHRLTVDPRMTLLDTLRERLGLTGAKKGCDQGQCGACTVHLDGRASLSCLTLAVAAQGRDVTTIEGLAAADGTLHPMQTAFVDNDAFQCGYCTPGQIMSAVAIVHDGHAKDANMIREAMSGNLCRCAAYPNIVAAIEQAAPQMKRG
ncbi:(2Fe-2S)-binding protein [Polymorphobacter sp. PAMC 29334]|uniref:(2Fe-2S)-binding protein n=1 Tax=Polymorphobacter sp. PAMC 29334 TaxID=2862331 RepID=UPI001D00FFD2|nr:(2Fe-2S)-binding protein [Polymorphobacter sp. PAMC 29334]